MVHEHDVTAGGRRISFALKDIQADEDSGTARIERYQICRASPRQFHSWLRWENPLLMGSCKSTTLLGLAEIGTVL
jgi:hypothetical protein